MNNVRFFIITTSLLFALNTCAMEALQQNLSKIPFSEMKSETDEEGLNNLIDAFNAPSQYVSRIEMELPNDKHPWERDPLKIDNESFGMQFTSLVTQIDPTKNCILRQFPFRSSFFDKFCIPNISLFLVCTKRQDVVTEASLFPLFLRASHANNEAIEVTFIDGRKQTFAATSYAEWLAWQKEQRSKETAAGSRESIK
jgi:hypothetical protein